MPRRALRFGIGDRDLRRAATWKLWTETAAGKSEVYLACRSLGGILKASLHESGAWHIAYSAVAFEEHVKDAMPAQGRFIHKWPRPAGIAPGVTLAFRIVTPWSAAVIPVEESGVKDVIWVPPAPEPQATEVDVIITAPAAVVTGWPGKRSMGTSLIGFLSLNNGETVWAVYRIVAMPDPTKAGKGTTRFYRGKTAKDLDGSGLRALVMGDEPDGSRVLYDCVVERSGPVPDSSAGSVGA